MRNKFSNYIKEHNLFSHNDKLLVGVSGGIDSIALTHLLYVNNYKFDIVHCNFQLRGDDSDKDEEFVRSLSETYKTSFHSKRFFVKNFAKKHKLSIQMAARELRYQWFEEMRKSIKAAFILVGHHSDDDIETFFINLIRGTGIQGMLGINKINNQIIRPLLFATRKEIELYVDSEKLIFRKDISNTSNKYLRNQIRNQLIPIILSLNPSFSNTFIKERLILQQVHEVYKKEMIKTTSNIISYHKDCAEIDIDSLKKLQPLSIYLYELLSPYGFPFINNIELALSGKSGKQFFSHTHRLIIDRKRILITSIDNQPEITCRISKTCKKIIKPISLKFKTSKSMKVKQDNNIGYFDYDKLVFPLILRKWQSGDKFMPLGMKNYKKVSDFFIDEKISLLEKENTWFLCSENEIIWITGRRIDNRYKIQESTKKMYIATLL
ncbi:MAG: tRNA lysidine(34) synthetase TilS [Bacteroidota bacterium]|nr:tRNA lysidine(34) synthetase TilS [Bacteroidota bacterium]